VDRGAEKTADDIHIYFLPIERGWVWQIPITDEITSLGVVVEKEKVKEAHLDLEEFFQTQIHTNNNLVRAMSNAERISEFKTDGDYSYSMKKFVGDGYLLVGDAARFVDPIFSSGVSVALHSAKFASEHIAHALELNDFREEVFMPYECKLRKGVELWYEFIRLYYKLLPLFTYFIQISEYREQVHRLLQGEVFNREEVPVLQAMRDYIDAVERTDKHIFKKQLSNIPVNGTLPELMGDLPG
jgi:FADH2 O2-dependent halogenase